MGYQALLFCPDEKLARVVSQVFSELDFAVDPVNEPFAAVKKLMAQRYDAVVVDCDNEQNTALLFKSAHNSSFNQNSLAIALVEGQAGVAKAYRIGANLVLTKPINVEQSKGTLRVARGLLRKNADGANAPAPVASATPARPSAPAPVARPVPVASRPVEAVALPPAAKATEFEAPLGAMAASAKIEQRPVVASAPSVQSNAPAFQATDDDDLFLSDEPAQPAARAEASKPAVVATPVASMPSKTQGAAAAPAPAREIAVPAEKKLVAVEPVTEKPVSFPAATGMSDGPSFAALDSQDASGSGGSKKILIAAVAVVVLVVAGYFGWTKFGGASHQTASPQPATSAPQPSGAPADLAPMSSPAPAPSAGVTNRASATTPATTTKTAAAGQQAGSNAAASTAKITLETEPEVKKAVPAPIQVKSAATTARKQASADEPAPLPSPLAMATPNDSNISGLMSSAASNVARPSLARIKISQGVSQGLVIKRVPPKYPPSALAAHTQGVVQIEATVNKDGNVVNPKVLSGDPVLAAAAIEAVRQWRYKPYYLDGEPVEIQTQITINFKAN